jgi:hypothetical protein
LTAVLVPDLAVVTVLVVLGAGALGVATWLAVREPGAATGGRARATSPLVPWVGSGLAVLLAVRGAIAGAGVVVLATLVHAGLARWRVARPRPRAARTPTGER